ncbi:MAG: AAA family ATPase, partial [Gammaproteobacteria bacterium]|nr:AAA family ATPase [Gammaproteobacteria bacterium]
MKDQAPVPFLVPIERLRRVCAPEEIPYERSDEPAPGGAHPGQGRAIDALQFGLQIAQDGYNVFVLGQAGSDRHRLARQLVEEHAATEKAPRDWCYVNNFLDPERPRALSFDAGKGSTFREDMRALIDELRFAIPAAFEAEDYRTQRKAIEADTQHSLEALWKDLEERAATENIDILQTPTGYVLAPTRDGKVMDEEEFNKLPDDERQKIQATIERLSEELHAHIEKLPGLRKQHREQVKALNRQITEHAVGVLLSELKEKYASQPEVVTYLDEVQADLVENDQDFRKGESPMLPFQTGDQADLFVQYEVNLVVSNKAGASAPVVHESNPTYSNIIGKIEHRAEMGTLLTDFGMIRGGGLLAANGGYLILDAERLLSRPFSWEALKRALFSKSVRIESPGETYGFVSTTTLRPEPIPLDIKIIVVGDRRLYYLLSDYDSEFIELFKVAADLDDHLKRSKENVSQLALVIADRVRERELNPFSRDAVQRIIEHMARTAEDSERLSMHMRSLDDLLVQSDYWARQRGVDLVDAEDVRRAIEQALRRLNRVQTRVAEAIERDNLLIDSSGSQVGQVNGLTVIDLGEFRFGHPVRITATTRIGTGDVIDIEREVELGGAIHSKGMLILSAALSVRYAADAPLSLQG